MFRAVNDARFWDRIATKYAADTIADMAGYERTLARTRDFLDGGQTAFEFGCGTGTTALGLAPFVARMVATDISGNMIAIARQMAPNRALHLSGLTPPVARVFHLTRMDSVFTILESGRAARGQ